MIIAGNFENKYESNNFIKKFLVKGFLETITNLALNCEQIHSVLEVGCGEGYILKYLQEKKPGLKLVGVDISPEMVKLASQKNPQVSITQADAHNLPFQKNNFDLVLLCEVLEHLRQPEKAIKEARRVAKKYCLFSVPNEPWWRLLNLTRFKYLRRLGNTPGHINHWTRQQFLTLISQHLELTDVKNPLPWTIVKTKKPAN